MQEQKCYFSIIIPVYNCEKYVAECLDSCLEQDIPSDEYEIICIDDGSTDKSPKILDDYAAKYPNINVIHKENEGVSIARNTGIDAALGEYLWFVDSDDLIKENILSTLKQSAQKKESPSYFFEKYDFAEEFTEKEKERKKNGTLSPVKNVPIGYITNKFYKKELILKAGIRHVPGIQMGEDELFQFEFSKVYGAPEKIDVLAYFYRLNLSSIQHSGTNIKRTQKRANELTKHILFLYEEQKHEEGEMRERTIRFMFDRRQALFEYGICPLPFSNFISELKKAKKKGVFSINSLAKEANVGKKQKHAIGLLLKIRWKYLCKERIPVFFERLAHPIRTIKNLRARKKDK